MEVRSSNPAAMGRMIAAATPVLLISMGYIDPGKWVACMDSGARFGSDFMPFVLLFNLFGVLCYYLSAHIGAITRRNLAQICSEEYGKLTCVFLGIQAGVSVICLELTMIVGIAQGLSMILGMELFTSVLLMALNAVLYPLFSTLMESSRFKVLVVYTAGLTFVCYVLVMMICLPEFPVTLHGSLSKFSSESAFALMSLLGASVMPHYFYFHSSVVQRYQAPVAQFKDSWSHENFVVTVTISSGFFLINYALMNSAASAFYSTGLDPVTFQDSMSIVDQVFRNPMASISCFVILFLANQITALSWEFCTEGRETILHDFFKIDLPVWLHCATVRIFAVIAALLCLWHSGFDGIYHLLICTQVIIALLLPSSVLPLFRVASSRTIMGLSKIPPSMDFVVILAFMGMLGLEIIFLVEMIFGESDWVSNLRWNMGSTTSIAYLMLLFTACCSIPFLLWLAATPLKSASARVWETRQIVQDPCTKTEGNNLVETRHYQGEASCQKEFLSTQEKSQYVNPDISATNYDISLPGNIMDSIQESHLSTFEENVPKSFSRDLPDPKQSVASVESGLGSDVVSKASETSSLVKSPVKGEATGPIEKTVRVEGDLTTEKYSEDGDSWEPEEQSKDAPELVEPIQEGPRSFRNLRLKSDEDGIGIGSVPRLSGLGRAARRQFAAALDEFWGQLYDFHGQILAEAKMKKFDLLLGMNSKLLQSQLNPDSSGKDSGMRSQFQPLRSRVPDNSMNSAFLDPATQEKFRNYIESACRFPSVVSGSIWSSQLPFPDKFGLGSNRRTLDSGERRHQSLRLHPSYDSSDHQPATIHGIQFSSYFNQIAKGRSEYINGQSGSLPQKSPSSGYKLANGRSSMKTPPGFQSLAVRRNNIARSVKNMESGNDEKRYHSLPDISGISVSLQNKHSSNTTIQTSFGLGQTHYQQSSYASVRADSLSPLAFDELSPSRAYKDSLMGLNSGSNPGSLWSTQPFEQFGVANKSMSLETEGPKTQSDLMATEPDSVSLVEIERKLIQSLRTCILKLLKLDGSEWLFRPNDGMDEYLIEQLATRERFFYEVESQEQKQASADEAVISNLVSSIPQCGDRCVYKVDLIVSFGVWSIHRILELSLIESRPELWGKYTYVLNRLQGVIEMAFFKPRTPMSPCFCLEVRAARSAKGRPTVTSAAVLLDVVKDVETAIYSRKGRSGTAAGNVAFPKGKENLASVLKRYRRRLSNKPVCTNDGGPGPQKNQSSSSSSYRS